MKVTQSACQVYQLRNIGEHHVWADIFIDAIDGSPNGAILIRSDYGSYDYYWSSCGCPLKQFLCEIGDDYLINKLSYGKPTFWDTDTFVMEFRKILDDKLKSDELSKEDYDTANEELDELDANTSEGVTSYIAHETVVLKTFEYEEYPSGNITDPQLVMFVEKIWHPFINDVLKKELANVPA